MSRLPLVAVLTLGACAAAVAAQGPAAAPPAPQAGPTFKAQIEYVEVDAVVTDAQGQLVRNLPQEAFTVLEDGVPQTITAFTTVDLPIEREERLLTAARAVEPDTQSNERPFDGRVYVLVLDDIHVDLRRTARVKQLARRFIEHDLGANDLMAVVTTGGTSDGSQEFTANKRLLLAAVDRFMGRKMASPTMARNEQYYRQLDLGPVTSAVDDPNEKERAFNDRATLSTLQQVSEWFGGVRGRRKSLLFVSEGIDYDVTNLIGTYDSPATSASTILSDLRDTIAATAKANVSIYAIDPRGLSTGDEAGIDVTEFADMNDPSGGAGIGMRGLQNELRLSQDSLKGLSDSSGGLAVVGRNDAAAMFDRIVRDNSSYYVLAYYPPTAKPDGKFHRIEVKVNRPGLTVRARRGYALPKPAKGSPKSGSMEPQLAEVLASPLPVSGLSMRAFAAPFKGTGQTASVVLGVELAGRSLSLAPNSKVDLAFMAVDAKGKTLGARNESLTLNLKPDTRARVEQSGLRLLNRLELPPGRYQLRVGTRDSGNGAVGSVLYDLEVPDFRKAPLSISGLTLPSMGGSAMLTARPDDLLKTVLPAPPIGQRTFARNDEIALFAEVYEAPSKTPHAVDITASIVDERGAVVFKTDDARDSKELQGKAGGYGVQARIPLSDIAPGSYTLRLSASSRLGNGAPVTRETAIRIVAAPSR